MDSLPDLVWRVLLEKGGEIQLKYSTWLSDAMPKPKRQFLTEEKAWDDLLEAILEAVKRLKAQAFKEALEYTAPGPTIRKTDLERQEDRYYEQFYRRPIDRSRD